jgi:hypothetical protein
VAQVLLTLPCSFSQLGMLSGVILQVFYGILGSWTAYIISVLYIEYRTRKEKENVNFKNHVIQVCMFLFSFYHYFFLISFLKRYFSLYDGEFNKITKKIYTLIAPNSLIERITVKYS